MTDEAEVAKRVAAVLAGEFYVGRRVRGTFGTVNRHGVVYALKQDGGASYASVLFDGNTNTCDIYLWALEAV